MSKKLQAPVITPRDSEAIARYLNEISKKKYDQMSDAEINARYASYIASKTAIKPEGDEKLLHPVINANLRFVVSVAKVYLNNGLMFEDLVAEGNIGLMEAAKRFDPDKGNKFITYAVHYIEYYIKVALYKHSRTVRLPEDKIKNYYKIKKFIDNYTALNGVEPTTDEIADRFGLPEKCVRETLVYNNSVTESLDPMFEFDSENDRLSLIDTLYDADTDADADVNRDDMANALRDALGSLNSREKEVIRLFCGFDGEAMSAKEIAVEWGVTPDYVGQIRRSAKTKLRLKIA